MKAIRLATLIALSSAVTAFAAPEPAQPLTFEQLAKTEIQQPPPPPGHGKTRFPELQAPEQQDPADLTPVFPEELKKLDGKHVKIVGFVAPYEDPDKMSKFLLYRMATGCFFCNPPRANGIVLVRLAASEKPINMDHDTLSVEGTLHLVPRDTKDEDAKSFFFTIDDAKATPSDL